jgi:hypothetical protein
VTNGNGASMDPVLDAIEQARRGGIELNERQIAQLEQLRDEREPGVRFAIGTDPVLTISVLDADHEQWVARQVEARASLPAWTKRMRREVVALALPDWTWQDGDDVGVSVGRCLDTSDTFTGVSMWIWVARPGSDESDSVVLSGERVADLLSSLFAGGIAEADDT